MSEFNQDEPEYTGDNEYLKAEQEKFKEQQSQQNDGQCIIRYKEVKRIVESVKWDKLTEILQMSIKDGAKLYKTDAGEYSANVYLQAFVAYMAYNSAPLEKRNPFVMSHKNFGQRYIDTAKEIAMLHTVNLGLVEEHCLETGFIEYITPQKK